MQRLLSALVLVSGLAIFATPVFAIGTDDPPTPTAKQQLETGKKAIYAGKYDEGIAAMKKIIKMEPRSADAHNYLGFSYRKQGRLKLAASSYLVALRIDPKHKGALEYQGELFLKMNDLAAAKMNHAKLAALCADGCKELKELTRAIADYTAAQGSQGSS